MSSISVRPYDPNDLDPILELLRVSLGESEVNRKSPELFAWKHFDNPFGHSIMLVAEDSEGIIGFRAFMRWELVTPRGDTIRCVRSVDTATHPRARRRGVFRTLTMAAIDAARSDHLDLIFNTPNPHSKAGYLTMGWLEVGQIGVLVRPRMRMLARSRPGVPEVEGSHPWLDQPIAERRPLGLRTARTPRYTGWRFRHPFAGYRILGDRDGLAVLRPNRRRGRQELVVSDLFGRHAGRALREAVRATDADYLVGWFKPDSPERKATRTAGMLAVPGARALTLVARPLRPNLELFANDLDAWDLAISDLELL